MQESFVLEGVRRVAFGRGESAKLAAEVELLGGGPVLVVVDPGVLAAGVAAPALKSLEAAGIKHEVYSQITREPEPGEADQAAALGKTLGARVVAGIGGGSALDVAKAAGVMLTNPGEAADYIGLDKVKLPGRPVICLPTTAGTGSEVTFTAVFTRRADGLKGGINGRLLYPHTAILDPLLTASCPPYITAITGLDALTHAMEAYMSRQAHPVSEMNALNAISLVGEHLRAAVAHGGNLEAREGLMLASHLAGLALAQSGVGACHAMAYPLGAFHEIPHGEANAVLLPYVLEYNLIACPERLAAMGRALAEPADGLNTRQAAEACVEEVFSLNCDLGIPLSLADLGVPVSDLPRLAAKAMTVARPIENNPRKVSAEDLEGIYRATFAHDEAE